jgi:hypothetical protein
MEDRRERGPYDTELNRVRMRTIVLRHLAYENWLWENLNTDLGMDLWGNRIKRDSFTMDVIRAGADDDNLTVRQKFLAHVNVTLHLSVGPDRVYLTDRFGQVYILTDDSPEVYSILVAYQLPYRLGLHSYPLQ